MPNNYGEQETGLTRIVEVSFSMRDFSELDIRQLGNTRANRATQEDIEIFEAEFGVILPDEYKSFLMSVNGVYPEVGLWIFWRCRFRMFS